MQPVQNTQNTYNTLEEIRQRKEQLLAEIDNEGKQISSLWGSIFVKREDATKSDYIASIVANSVTIVDLFLLYRKIRKQYGSISALFGRGKKKH